MEAHPFITLFQAITIVLEPLRFFYLSVGVLMGLVLGIIPGLGGLVGLSILLPFTFSLDPLTALAMMLGLTSVTVTSDTIPAVLFSVPGTVGSAATILDGFPMARKGEAGRAFGAAFSASVIGGIFGALLLGLSIPVLRPLVLKVGSPELLAICIFGLSLVASLSGGSLLTGLASVCLGILVAEAGDDPQTATLRWTFGTLYLWDGVPLVPLALGLFALPEIADLAISRKSISGDLKGGSRWGQLEGIKDVFRHFWLVLRCCSIGSILGAIPGMGAAVVCWIAYGHAVRTEKGADKTFGKGDVRGVIASESSNNAKEGGALIPTVAFGVPGSASMALLLGAFLIHNIVPGPAMLTKHLDVTYTLVWSVALANIIGAGICFLFADQLAKIALIRIGILAPLVLAVVYVGVFQASNSWGDLYALLIFGLLGWLMKRVRWPRPPMILGFVLGMLIERYMFISFQRYGFRWLGFPVVIAMFALTFFGIFRPMIGSYMKRRKGSRRPTRLRIRPPKSVADVAFTTGSLAVFVFSLVTSSGWEIDAKLVPQAIAWAGLIFAGAHLMTRFIVAETVDALAGGGASANIQGEADKGSRKEETHYDTGADFSDISTHTMLARAGVFFAWCLFYIGAAALIGMLPAMVVFLIGYVRFHGKESWKLTLSVSLPTGLFCYIVFHKFLLVVWPKSLLGNLFPILRTIESLNFL